MITKIVKNTTISDIEIPEVGVTIPASSSYTIDPANYYLWASGIVDSITNNTAFHLAIDSGDLVISDGINDLLARLGKSLLEDYLVDLSKNFYVSKNGSDTEGNGSINRPFLTINACISFINDNYTLSASNNAVIHVSAGEYIENTIVLPSFCSLWGHHYRTRIKHSTGLADLIQSAGSHTIKGLLLTGVTASDKYLISIDTPSGKRVTLQDISFSDYEDTGIISNAIYINSAALTTVVRVKQCDFGDIQGKLIYLDNKSKVVIRGMQIFDCSNATMLDVNNDCSYSAYDIDIDSLYIGLHHKNSVESDASNINLLGATIPFIKNNNYSLKVKGVTLSSPTAEFTTLENTIGYWQDVVEGDTSFRIGNELSVGTSNKGKESVFGEGDSYFIGMKVYTSDGTDTSTTEGTLTDVTTDAQKQDTNYFGFQGSTTNHCIYVCSDVQNDAFGSVDYARIMGLKVAQITACVESTAKSIAIESWDGSAWVEGSTFANHSSLFYRYGNDLFIRANSSEHIRFGKDLIVYNNVKKTIVNRERYWIRLRIKNNLTTAPTFNQFKISNNRTEINADGTITMHGRARFTVALPFQANTFGETGGVTNADFRVGDGVDFPHDYWDHQMKNNRLNGDNDAVMAVAVIPEGCCTSCPMIVKIKYLVLNSGASTNGLFKVSMYPSTASGILVADRSGGITPIARTLANTSTINSGEAQVKDVPIQLDTDNKIITTLSGGFSVVDYYEGDIMFFRIGLDDDGSGKKDIAIIGVDIEYVKWTLGAKG